MITIVISTINIHKHPQTMGKPQPSLRTELYGTFSAAATPQSSCRMECRRLRSLATGDLAQQVCLLIWENDYNSLIQIQLLEHCNVDVRDDFP